jgi:hypothetical protein
MAKKVRRPRKRQINDQITAEAAVEKAASKSLTAQEAFESEYAYVMQDLRWVFILAAIMFALLIALNILLGS